VRTYSVRGLTVATAASADQVICHLWNASSSRKIYVVEMSLFKTAAGTSGDSVYIQRVTARGTQTSTVTPDIDNDWDHELAPPSGAVLDVDFSAEPTAAGPALSGFAIANVISSGFLWPCPRRIAIKAGNGLAMYSRLASFPISEAYFQWEE
jgi:hypothetical protein